MKGKKQKLTTKNQKGAKKVDEHEFFAIVKV
jgi:hypothetical protein